MYLKIDKKKKIKIIILKKFWERFKGLKFVFEKLDYGVKFPRKKKCNTNFLVQNIDIILTDKNEKIIYMQENVGTEVKIKRRRHVYNTYFLPLGTVKYFKVGDILEFIEKE